MRIYFSIFSCQPHLFHFSSTCLTSLSFSAHVSHFLTSPVFQRLILLSWKFFAPMSRTAAEIFCCRRCLPLSCWHKDSSFVALFSSYFLLSSFTQSIPSRPVNPHTAQRCLIRLRHVISCWVKYSRLVALFPLISSNHHQTQSNPSRPSHHIFMHLRRVISCWHKYSRLTAPLSFLSASRENPSQTILSEKPGRQNCHRHL